MTGAPEGTRDRLLGAARQVVARDGLEGLTLRAIAREAGVSHGAPLRHFPNLPALLAAVSARGFRELMAGIDGHIEDVADPRRRVARSGVAYIGFALEAPGVFGLMFRPELCDTSDPEYRAAGAASFGQLRDLVGAAQAGGWKADHPVDHLTVVLWANVHGLAQLWLHGAAQAVVGPGALDDLVELSTTLALGER